MEITITHQGDDIDLISELIGVNRDVANVLAHNGLVGQNLATLCVGSLLMPPNGANLLFPFLAEISPNQLQSPPQSPLSPLPVPHTVTTIIDCAPHAIEKAFSFLSIVKWHSKELKRMVEEKKLEWESAAPEFDS